MVSKFYHDIAMLPVITDQEMGSAMQQLSAQQVDEFDTVAALKELYIYVTKYRDSVSTLKMCLYCLLSSVTGVIFRKKNPFSCMQRYV